MSDNGWEADNTYRTMRIMRHSPIFIAIAALTGCGEAQPIDCEVALKEVFACMDRMKQAEERSGDDIFDECVPMSEPQRFQGTWATDFEFNQFYKGAVVAAEDAWQFPETTTRLWGEAVEKYSVGDMAYVIEIEFVGRQPICNCTEPVRDIVVDDLVSARVIERRPSSM